MKRKKITGRVFVSINGADVPWENLSLEKRAEISAEFNKRFITAFYQAKGYQIKEKTA